MTFSGTPPEAGTLRISERGMLAKRMSPPEPHVPAVLPPSGMSQMVTGAAPSASWIRLSLPGVKKPIDFPSGDQKSELASSVPATGRD